MKAQYLSVKERSSYHCLEDIVGCKWSAAVVGALGRGVNRPGELERFIPGISTKVLNERLRKLIAYGLVVRTEFPGLPARVEYTLTQAGKALQKILDQLKKLDASLDRRKAE